MNEVNPALIARLQARAEFGTAKYGVPLTPWNGRNPLEDQEEELLDRWVYIQQDKMERVDAEKLIMKIGYFISWMEDHYQEIIDEFAGDKISSSPLFEMGRLLRADVPRIGVPATRHLSGGPMSRLEDMEKS